MRKTKFKGKCVYDDRWVFGSLLTDLWCEYDIKNVCEILTTENEYESWEDLKTVGNVVKVYPESVGEYIGIKGFISEHEHKQPGDKEVELFEGDIVESWSAGANGTFVIKFREGICPGWFLYPNFQSNKFWYIYGSDIGRTKGDYYDNLRVIGNIYDTPQLIKLQ